MCANETRESTELPPFSSFFFFFFKKRSAVEYLCKAEAVISSRRAQAELDEEEEEDTAVEGAATKAVAQLRTLSFAVKVMETQRLVKARLVLPIPESAARTFPQGLLNARFGI